MFIGEAPSYYEDKEGVPFVGPAGAIFNKVLARARLDRDEAYVTNVEKFKHSKKMGRNQPPKQSEIDACRPWLLKEIAIVQPEIICCLGALAARWVLGKDFRLMRQHGEWLASDFAPSVLATIHPAVVLNRRDEDSRAEAEEMLLADIRKVARRYRALEAERGWTASRAA
jgi:DNA polymerase